MNHHLGHRELFFFLREMEFVLDFCNGICNGLFGTSTVTK